MSSSLLKKSLYFLVLIFAWGALLFNVMLKHQGIKMLDVPPVVLEFDIMLPKDVAKGERGVFYYDTGKGFNKGEVAVCRYDTEVVNEKKRYSVTLMTGKKIEKLRFDPLDGAGLMELSNLTIKRHEPVKVDLAGFDLDSAQPNEIEKILVQGDELLIVSKGNDPFFILIPDFSDYDR